MSSRLSGLSPWFIAGKRSISERRKSKGAELQRTRNRAERQLMYVDSDCTCCYRLDSCAVLCSRRLKFRLKFRHHCTVQSTVTDSVCVFLQRSVGGTEGAMELARNLPSNQPTLELPTWLTPQPLTLTHAESNHSHPSGICSSSCRRLLLRREGSVRPRRSC